MKDRLFLIPTMVILTAPFVAAILCMILEWRRDLWGRIVSGRRATHRKPLTTSRPAQS
jgi:hypothetical protein